MVVLNPSRNDRTLGSFKINWQTGEWSDFADPNAKGGDLISLFAYINTLDQGQAARQIAEKLVISPHKTNGAAPRTRKTNSAAPSTRTIVMPVPADAPAPPATHPKLGRPTKSWPYPNADGKLIGCVLRFDSDGKEKEFRPQTLWRDSVSGNLEWQWESWPTPRPLYGLKELAERPSADVVVCEGEKATDAARRLLPDFVAVTSPNGSESADKADWSPLRGRNVVIWPDADSPGDVYAQAVAKCATDAGAKSIAIASPPSRTMPPGNGSYGDEGKAVGARIGWRLC